MIYHFQSLAILKSYVKIIFSQSRINLSNISSSSFFVVDIRSLRDHLHVEYLRDLHRMTYGNICAIPSKDNSVQFLETDSVWQYCKLKNQLSTKFQSIWWKWGATKISSVDGSGIIDRLMPSFPLQSNLSIREFFRCTEAVLKSPEFFVFHGVVKSIVTSGDEPEERFLRTRTDSLFVF